MKKILKIFAFISIQFFLVSQNGIARDISMVTVNWEPYYGDSLIDKGVITDIVQTAFKRAGHSSSIKFIPWKRALVKVTRGESDVLMGAYYTKERDKKYYTSDSIYSINVRLVSKKSLGVSKFSRLEDLKPYSIGVTRGFVTSEDFDNASFLNKKEAGTTLKSVKKLIGDRVQMVVMAEGIFNFEFMKVGKDKRDNYQFLDPILTTNELVLLGSKKNPQNKKLIDDFNKELSLMRKDGAYREILMKHGFASK